MRTATPQPGSLEAEFRALYDTLFKGLELVALRALGDRDEARDVVQESLTRAYDAVRRGDVPAGVPLGAFVRGIARHVTVDALRRRALHRPAPVDEAELVRDTNPNALDAVIAAERLSAVERALAALPASDRALLERCVLNGEPIADVAIRLGVPATRLRKQKSRALQRLRELLRSGMSRFSPPTDTDV